MDDASLYATVSALAVGFESGLPDQFLTRGQDGGSRKHFCRAPGNVSGSTALHFNVADFIPDGLLKPL